MKELCESSRTAFRLAEGLSLAADHTDDSITAYKAVFFNQRRRRKSPTHVAAFPLVLNQLLHPAHQLLPHAVKQQIQHGLAATSVRGDGGQAVVPVS